MDSDAGQVFSWGYGILGKGPKLERSFIPEQIPEKLFGASELKNVKVVDIQPGMYHMTALTGIYESFSSFTTFKQLLLYAGSIQHYVIDSCCANWFTYK